MVAGLEANHDYTSGDSGSAMGACGVFEGGEQGLNHQDINRCESVSV